MECVQKYYRMDKKEISFLKWIIEGYDGIALIRTVDAKKGVIAFHISPGCETIIESIIRDIQNDIMIEPWLET